jgi:hypothetical protein
LQCRDLSNDPLILGSACGQGSITVIQCAGALLQLHRALLDALAVGRELLLCGGKFLSSGTVPVPNSSISPAALMRRPCAWVLMPAALISMPAARICVVRERAVSLDPQPQRRQAGRRLGSETCKDVRHRLAQISERFGDRVVSHGVASLCRAIHRLRTGKQHIAMR